MKEQRKRKFHCLQKIRGLNQHFKEKMTDEQTDQPTALLTDWQTDMRAHREVTLTLTIIITIYSCAGQTVRRADTAIYEFSI